MLYKVLWLVNIQIKIDIFLQDVYKVFAGFAIFDVQQMQ